MDGNNLILEWKPAGRNGSATVTATLSDEVLAVNTFDLTKSKARERFALEVCKGRPGIDKEMVESELMRLAVERASKPDDSPLDLTAQPEIDISRIIRPERFITNEVSGIVIPKLVTAGGKVVGRWQLLVRWADGTREARALEATLDLPSGGRLWVHPEPGEPSTNMSPGWSSNARKRWLSGQPAPSPAILFRTICRIISHFLDLPSREAPGITATLATWVILSYVYPAWSAVPYLYLGGPAGSGKSTVFDLLSQLAFRALTSSSMTAASLFRSLNSRGGVLLLDEAERLKDVRSPEVGELVSMLLAGYKRGGTATRLEPLGDGSFRTVSFDVFGPKALACISGLPSALASRAISIMMFRAPPASNKPRRRIDAKSAAFQTLRDGLHAMAMEHGRKWLEMAGHFGICPPMGGRDYQLWQPLLAIASFVEDTGATGLAKMMQDHALATIDAAKDDQTPDCDETLLRQLANAIRDGERPTCGEILEGAKEIDPEGFKRWSAKGVSVHLKRYGLQTNKTCGRRCYANVTPDDLKRIETSYGVDLWEN